MPTNHVGLLWKSKAQLKAYFLPLVHELLTLSYFEFLWKADFFSQGDYKN